MANVGLSEMAQAVLTGYDTHLSSKWREEERGWKAEERQWRKEDIAFRRKEFEMMEAEKSMMQRQLHWHTAEVQQRALDNARVMWQRFVEKNRRSVEEHAEQLKSVSNLSALMAGFSVIGFLEFQFEEDEQNGVVVGLFGLFTALTVVLMVNCFVSCSLVLASILKTGKRYVAEEEEAEFIWQCHEFTLSYRPGDRPPMPHRSFEQHWQNRCEGEWRRAFGLYTLGVPSFLVQLILAAWIKFDKSPPTTIIMTVIIVGSIPYWITVQTRWAEHLFSREDSYKANHASRQPLGLPFDYHCTPVDPLMGEAREDSSMQEASYVSAKSDSEYGTSARTVMGGDGMGRDGGGLGFDIEAQTTLEAADVGGAHW